MAKYVADGRYRCPRCGETKSTEGFYWTLRHGTSRHRLTTYCRACHVDIRREQRAAAKAVAIAWQAADYKERPLYDSTHLGTLTDTQFNRKSGEIVQLVIEQQTPMVVTSHEGNQFVIVPIGALYDLMDGGDE